jgi:hypothetical protein
LFYQFFIVGVLPLTVMVLIANSKFFPKTLRDPLLFLGVIVVIALYRTLPFEEHVKDIAASTFLGLVIIFTVLAIKYKWLDRLDKWQSTNKK